MPSSGTKLPSVNAMKKSSTNNLLDNSRASNKDSRYGKDSRMNLNVQSKDQILSSSPVLDRKYESTINHLKNIIMKEKRKVKDLKNLYMR